MITGKLISALAGALGMVGTAASAEPVSLAYDGQYGIYDAPYMWHVSPAGEVLSVYGAFLNETWLTLEKDGEPAGRISVQSELLTRGLPLDQVSFPPARDVLTAFETLRIREEVSVELAGWVLAPHFLAISPTGTMGRWWPDSDGLGVSVEPDDNTIPVTLTLDDLSALLMNEEG